MAVRWFSGWRRFCTLLLLVFLARGVFLLSILPPFEGWDEYQHVAYVAYLVEKGRSPVLGDGNDVPRSLYAGLVQYPHPKLAIEQLERIGAREYGTFFSGGPPTVRTDADSIVLYQAQQAPLYYWLVAPIYRAMSGANHLLGLVTVLRGINVLLGAASLAVALMVLGRILRDGPGRYPIAILIALQPLFLLNCARVANDALAVFLGTVAVAAMFVVLPRHYWVGVLLAGVALGLGVLAKASDAALVPFVVCVFAALGWQRRLTPGRAVLGAGLVLGLTAAITCRYFYFNLAHFGVLTPLQEVVQNRQAGRTISDALRAAWEVEWWGKFSSRYCHYALWFGGWSWLKPPSILKHLHEYSIYLAAIGFFLALSRRIRRGRLLFADASVAWQLVLLCGGVAVGLAYHAVQTQMAFGSVATNAWYAAVSFPWLLCLYYQGLAFYPRRWPARVFAALMILLYLAAEIYGTLAMMVPAYTGSAWGSIARERLAAMHLPGLGPAQTMPALCAAVVLTIIAMAVWVQRERSAGGAVGIE